MISFLDISPEKEASKPFPVATRAVFLLLENVEKIAKWKDKIKDHR